MKLASFATAVTILLCSAAGLVAADNTDSSKITKPVKAHKEKKPAAKRTEHHDVATVTGSHLNRDAHHSGGVSDGPNMVYVLDSRTIQTSGATNLRELLTRKGTTR